MIVLHNYYHAGDVAMSRQIIRDLVTANPKVEFTLACRIKHAYLWQDFGFPIITEGVLSGINLHFAAVSNSLATGLTYQTQVNNVNQQCAKFGLHPVPAFDLKQRFVELPRQSIQPVPHPAVFLENGVVLSGQKVYDLNRLLPELSSLFSNVTFYHTASSPQAASPNLIDVSNWDLCRLAVLSEQCDVLVCRLSAAMVATFTEKNHGRVRIVYGKPLGCPIWDEIGVEYVHTAGELFKRIAVLLS